MSFKVCRPIRPSGSPSAQLNFALGLLKDDALQAFNSEYNSKVKQWGNDHADDAYFDTLINRGDMLNTEKMLRHWVEYLAKLPDCQHTRGAISTLSVLADLCSDIERLKPKEETLQ